jgi:hypothetical protein
MFGHQPLLVMVLASLVYREDTRSLSKGCPGDHHLLVVVSFGAPDRTCEHCPGLAPQPRRTTSPVDRPSASGWLSGMVASVDERCSSGFLGLADAVAAGAG